MLSIKQLDRKSNVFFYIFFFSFFLEKKSVILKDIDDIRVKIPFDPNIICLNNCLIAYEM